MKNLFLILCSLLLLTSCSDDDSESESSQNKITYNGRTYPVVKVEGLEVNNINGSNTFITGTIDQDQDYGFIIQLYGHTISSASGTYTVNAGDDYDPKIHCKVVMNLPDSDMLISEGEVSVNIKGETITIDFDVEELDTETPVIGYYEGSFIIQ